MGRNAWDMHIYGNSRFIMDGSQTGPLERSWMQVLRDEGYASVSVGKTHMIHAGSYHIPVPLSKTFGKRDGWDHFHVEKSPEPESTYYDIHVASRACDALERLQGDGPFALFVGFHAPHEPYVLPENIGTIVARTTSFCRSTVPRMSSARNPKVTGGGSIISNPCLGIVSITMRTFGLGSRGITVR